MIKRILCNAKILYEQEKIDEAEEVIDMILKVSDDNYEVLNFKGYLRYIQQDYSNAKLFLERALILKSDYIDAIVNLHYVFRDNGELEKSLEILEQSLVKIDELEIKIKLSDIYKTFIEETLKTNYYSNNEYINENVYKYKNVHFLYESLYCYEYVESINSRFEKNTDIFVFIVGEKNSDELELLSEKHPNVVLINLQTQINDLIDYFMNAESIYIHFLFEYICELYYKCRPSGKLVWVYWGGDFYNYVDFELYDEKTKVILQKIGFSLGSENDYCSNNVIYRNYTIRHLDEIHMFDTTFEYSIMKKNYLTNMFAKRFVYPNPIDYVSTNRVKKTDKRTTILIGNSGNPSNNHFDALATVKEMNQEEIRLIIPLSYGIPSIEYFKELINYIRNNLTCEVEILKEMLSPKEYNEILEKVDMAIFNHRRQQAVGNIRKLMKLGKIIVMNPESPLFSYLNNIDIKVLSVNDTNLSSVMKELTLNKEILQRNSEIIDTYFGENIITTQINKIFDDDEY